MTTSTSELGYSHTSAKGVFSFRLRKAATLAVIVTAALGQPNGFFLFFSSYAGVSAMIILSIMALAVANRWHTGRFVVPASNVWLPVLLYLSLCTISLAYAPSPTVGLRILASMMFKVIVFAALLMLGDDSARFMRHVLWVLLVLGAIFAFQAVVLVAAAGVLGIAPVESIGAIAVAGQDAYDFKMSSYGLLLGFTKTFTPLGSMLVPRAQGLFTEPGWFANFLELSLFATVAWASLFATRAGNWVRIAVIVQLAGLLLSLSTAGWFSVGVGAVVFLLVENRRKMTRVFLRMSRLIALAACAALLTGLIAPTIVGQVYDAVWTQKFSVAWATDEVGASADQRVRDVQRAWFWFSKRPIFGWGVSQLQVVNSGASANNALLSTAADTGIVGLLIYLWLLASIVGIVRTLARNAHRTLNARIIRFAAAIAAMMFALLTHSMFIETQWNFFYWLGIAITVLAHRFIISELKGRGVAAVLNGGKSNDLR